MVIPPVMRLRLPECIPDYTWYVGQGHLGSLAGAPVAEFHDAVGEPPADHHRAGYSDQSALTRAMRRATGLTPAAYRRQQQESQPNNR